MSAIDMATVTASTKRPPAVASGIVGEPVTNIASLLITPFMSASAELAMDANIQDPREAKLTYCFVDGNGALYDVAEGDVLVVGSDEYPIQSAAEFNRPGDGSYIRMVIQQKKVS